MKTVGFWFCVALFVSFPDCCASAALVDAFNVVWDSPSSDSSGSMPLGNGDIGLNAWVEPTGDLVFYISKTDAWSDNGRLLKIGKIRITFDPNPRLEAPEFQQTLRLQDATMSVCIGKGERAANVRLWVDANRPVIHVTVNSVQPLAATAQIELWRTDRSELPSIEVSDVMLDRSAAGGQHAPTLVEPDTVLSDQQNRIGWYHHNIKSIGPALTARTQGLSDFERPDPLLHRTFGAVIQARNGRRLDDLRLLSPVSTAHRFSVYVLTTHPTTPDQWLARMDQTIASVERNGFDARRATHERWWNEFWQRSWIHITSGEAAASPSLIPANAHDVRIGMDQQGHNRFAGEFGRITLYGSALDDETIRRLAETDHGGVLMKTLQAMLLQTDGDQICLFPAWPADWDVRFKLHASYKTTIEGELKNGKINGLTVTPKTRSNDVMIMLKPAVNPDYS